MQKKVLIEDLYTCITGCFGSYFDLINFPNTTKALERQFARRPGVWSRKHHDSACLTNNSRRDMSVILPSWEDASIFHAVLASLRESPTGAGKVTMVGLFLWIPCHTNTFATDSASPVGSRLHCLLVSYFHAFKFLIKYLIPSRWRFACRAYQEPWKVPNVCGMGCPSFFSVDCGDFW